MATEDEAMALEAGETGQDPADFMSGLTHDQDVAVQEMVRKLQTGKLYQGPDEAAVGDGLVEQAENDGFLAKVPDVFEALPTGALIAANTYVWEKVGNDLERVFGIGTTAKGEYGVQPTSSERKIQIFTGESRIPHVEPKECRKAAFSGDPGIPEGDLCISVEVHYHEETQTKSSPETTWKRASAYEVWTDNVGEYHSAPKCPPTIGSGTRRHLFGFDAGIECYQYEGEETRFYWNLSKVRDLMFPAGSHPKAKSEGGSVEYSTHAETAEAEPQRVPPVKSGTTLTPPNPLTVPVPDQTYVFHEREEELPGINEENEEQDEEERKAAPIPTPLEIEIPAPGQNELATTYVNTLHSDGFTKVEEEVLPQDDIDPRTGPNDVAYTDPAEGSKVNPGTLVTVEVNPEDAPAPESGGHMTGPTLPGIHFPNFEAACRNFPFGVPCWLVQEFEKWSGTAEAPKWTVKIKGIDFNLDLSPLESAMEIVRPILLAMGTIGIVLTFFHFAMGGTGPAPGGSGEGDD